MRKKQAKRTQNKTKTLTMNKVWRVEVPLSKVGDVPDCGIIGSEFEFQSRY